jgi:outer membrane protein assembly factor BamB
MNRKKTCWLSLLSLLLLFSLPLLGLTACGEVCEANPGPNLDPHLLSANGLIFLNSPFSHSLYAINMRNGSIRWANHISGSNTMLDNNILYVYNIFDENENNSYDISAFNASDGTQVAPH